MPINWGRIGEVYRTVGAFTGTIIFSTNVISGFQREGKELNTEDNKNRPYKTERDYLRIMANSTLKGAICGGLWPLTGINLSQRTYRAIRDKDIMWYSPIFLDNSPWKITKYSYLDYSESDIEDVIDRFKRSHKE